MFVTYDIHEINHDPLMIAQPTSAFADRKRPTNKIKRSIGYCFFS